MTGERLAELGRLCEAAPQPPWYAKENDLIGGWCVMPMDLTPAESPVPSVADFTDRAAAEFIAACRVGVEELVAEVRRLRAELARRGV
jgi:hypothetical protein